MNDQEIYAYIDQLRSEGIAKSKIGLSIRDKYGIGLNEVIRIFRNYKRHYETINEKWKKFDYNDPHEGGNHVWIAGKSPSYCVESGIYDGDNLFVALAMLEFDNEGYPDFNVIISDDIHQMGDECTITHYCEFESPKHPDLKGKG